MRPGAEAIRSIIAEMPNVTISHDPSGISVPGEGGSDAQADIDWFELLTQGLTFDIRNLAPGEGANLSEIQHRLGCPAEYFEQTSEAVCLLPGPHLSGGANSIPVVRILAELAAKLSLALSGTLALFWPPSGGLFGAEYYRAMIASWISGGNFPVLGFTPLKPMIDGGMQSDGLSFFTGQELRLEPETAADSNAAAQLSVRLVNYLVQRAPLARAESVIAPDGAQLLLEPSGNGRFVRVWRG